MSITFVPKVKLSRVMFEIPVPEKKGKYYLEIVALLGLGEVIRLIKNGKEVSKTVGILSTNVDLKPSDTLVFEVLSKDYIKPKILQPVVSLQKYGRKKIKK